MATDELIDLHAAMNLTHDARSRGAPSYGARVRFGLAGFLRCSERLLDGLVSAYERVCSLDERDQAEIYQTMGEDFARRGNDGEAIEALQTTLTIRPDSENVRLQLGLLQLRQGDAAAAVATLEQAKANGHSSLELHCALAEAYAQVERPDDVVDAYRAALQCEPEAAEVAFKLGTTLDALKRYAEAAEVLTRAVELAPEDADYHQSLGFALESLGRRREAIDCFKRAIQLDRKARQ